MHPHFQCSDSWEKRPYGSVINNYDKIISNHYKADENLFKFCIELFGSYLKLKYSDVVNPSKTTFTKMTKDYQEFLSMLIDLVVIYYKLEDR